MWVSFYIVEQGLAESTVAEDVESHARPRHSNRYGMTRYWSMATLALLCGAGGCRPHPVSSAIAEPLLSAPFLVAGPAPVPHREPALGTRPERDGCSVTGRFEGAAHPRGDERLEVAIERGWAIVTRNNDKQWDDLHLRLEATGQLGGESATIVLGPTVDSAGPSLTSWQSQGPLRLLIPWYRALTTRRLMFWLSYSAIGFDGAVTRCQIMMRSDTLRFLRVEGTR